MASRQKPLNRPTNPTQTRGCHSATLDDRMNLLAYRVFEGRSCWAGRDQGGLPILEQVDRNIPGACGAKLVKRIDARPAEAPDLKAAVWHERAGIRGSRLGEYPRRAAA